MPKLNPNLRHHSARPLSAVKPNTLVNDKPNYTPPETASMPTPNPNPSLGPVGVDAANMRLNAINMADDSDDELDDDGSDDSDDNGDEDRSPKHLS